MKQLDTDSRTNSSPNLQQAQALFSPDISTKVKALIKNAETINRYTKHALGGNNAN